MSHKVLRGVSFAIASGTLVGIVGENGVGKSILLRSGAMGYCPQQVILNQET